MKREQARVCCGLGGDAVVGFVQLGKDQVSTRLTFSAWKKKAHVLCLEEVKHWSWLQERNEPEDVLGLLQFSTRVAN